MHDYKDSIIKALGIKDTINNENRSATDEISGLSMGSDAAKTGNGKSLLQLSDKDLDNRLDELI